MRRDNRKVIFTIFAGRKYYLEVLFKYLDYLIDNDKIQEVHLWNYTKNETDNIYLNSLVKNKYFIFKPKNKNGRQWDDYYKYYCKHAKYNDNDIIIKCDDDVVFIDIDYFDAFIDQVGNKNLYFPNIVNNDVCAFIQSKNNIHQLLTNVRFNKRGNVNALSDWYKMYDKAKLIHLDFLSNPKKYVISCPNINISSRISINFFAGQLRYIKKLYNCFCKAGKNDDEGFMARICRIKSINHNSLLLANQLLIDYYILADRLLKKIDNLIKIPIYGTWSEKHKEFWIKKKLDGNGREDKNFTMFHTYNNEIIEIPGLDFPGQDITSMKCSNIDEAREKFRLHLNSEDFRIYLNSQDLD
jgi:hypothetical protein